MSLTNYLEEKILEHVFSGTPYTAPAQWYLTAYTTMPAEDGTGGVECSGGSWGGRQAIDFDPYDTGGVPSTADVTLIMPAAEVVGFGLVDASSAGNIGSLKTLDTPRTYTDGEPVLAAAGDIKQMLD